MSTSSSVAGVTAAGDADAARSAAGKTTPRDARFSRLCALFFAKRSGKARSSARASTTALATPRAAFGADAEVTYPRTVWRSHPRASDRRSVFFSFANTASNDALGAPVRAASAETFALRRGRREHRRADGRDAAVETPHDRARVRDARDARDAFLLAPCEGHRRARPSIAAAGTRFPGGGAPASRRLLRRALHLLRRRRARGEVFGERGRARGDGEPSPLAQPGGARAEGHEREPEFLCALRRREKREPRIRATGHAPPRLGAPDRRHGDYRSVANVVAVARRFVGRSRERLAGDGGEERGRTERGNEPRTRQTRRTRRTRRTRQTRRTRRTRRRAASRGDALRVDARFERTHASGRDSPSRSRKTLVPRAFPASVSRTAALVAPASSRRRHRRPSARRALGAQVREPHRTRRRGHRRERRLARGGGHPDPQVQGFFFGCFFGCFFFLFFLRVRRVGALVVFDFFSENVFSCRANTNVAGDTAPPDVSSSVASTATAPAANAADRTRVAVAATYLVCKKSVSRTPDPRFCFLKRERLGERARGIQRRRASKIRG